MRVEFRTREANIRSQRAIEKLGAIREGMLRCDRINDDGSFRNTYVYSVIRPDWELIKTKLKPASMNEMS
jgi:RimJ/RimL family protein N-acetyltransferase